MKIKVASFFAKACCMLLTLIIGIVTFCSSSVSATDTDFSWIKTLLEANVSAYDPSNQTIVVLNSDIVLSKYALSQDIDIEDTKNRKNVDNLLFINGAGITDPVSYWVLNQEAGTVIEKTSSLNYRHKIQQIPATVAGDDLVVLLIDDSDTFKVAPDDDSWFWDYSGSNNNRYHLNPSSDNIISGYEGVASGGILSTDFIYEVYEAVECDIEIWTTNLEKRTVDNPGFLGIDSYLDLKIELRDASGNISPLKGFVVYYANYDELALLDENGVFHLPITPDGEDYYGSYGEFEIYAPQGYDVRITPVDYGKELGSFGHIYVTPSYIINDAEGFFIMNGSSFPFMELDFLPRIQNITVKNINLASSDASSEYYYKVYQTVSVNTDEYDSETSKYIGVLLHDQKLLLSNYQYRLFDVETNEEIEPEVSHFTDANGILTLRANQYAVFDVYGYPEDILEYEDSGGTNIFDELRYNIGIDNPRPYYFEAIDWEQYNEIYNGDTFFTNNLAVAYPNETVTYVIDKKSEDPEPEDETIIPVPDTGADIASPQTGAKLQGASTQSVSVCLGGVVVVILLTMIIVRKER